MNEHEELTEEYEGPWHSALTRCLACGWEGASVWPAVLDASELECECGHVGLEVIEDCAAQGEG
jgi:hypothetical protein